MDDLKEIDEHSLAELLAALRRDTLDHSEPGRTIQDLQVHQIELEAPESGAARRPASP